MRGPLDIDDVDELELDAETPQQRRAAAARLAAWSEERHPEDDAEVTPAMLLAHAGEQLTSVGDHEAALDLYRRAAQAEGDVVPDVRCHLHHGLIEVGDLEAARRLAEEVRRSRPTDVDVFLLIAEDYEAIGDLVEANRWMNLGLRRLTQELEDPDGPPPEIAHRQTCSTAVTAGLGSVRMPMSTGRGTARWGGVNPTLTDGGHGRDGRSARRGSADPSRPPQ